MTESVDDWRSEQARKEPYKPQSCCDHAGLFYQSTGCQLCGCQVGRPPLAKDRYEGLRGFDGQPLDMYRGLYG